MKDRPASPGGGARVLLLGSPVAGQRSMAAAIEGLGYAVLGAGRPGDPVGLCRELRPRMVVIEGFASTGPGRGVVAVLRSHPETALLPIVVVLASDALDDRLASFDAGADDALPAELEPVELDVRMMAVLRRIPPATTPAPAASASQSTVVAVHSLRGGVGVTSLAVNLALGLHGLWAAPTILIDLTHCGGQAAFFLDRSPVRSWAESPRAADHGVDAGELDVVVVNHPLGIDVIGSPSTPPVESMATVRNLQPALAHVRSQYEYVVLDLGHDLRFASQFGLANADHVVLPVAPELASIRATTLVLDHLARTGYPDAQIHMVVNWTFEKKGVSLVDMERHFGHRAELVIPHAPGVFIEAINTGLPILARPKLDPIGALIEDFAYRLSARRSMHAPDRPQSPQLVRTLRRMKGKALPDEHVMTEPARADASNRSWSPFGSGRAEQ